MLTFISFWRAAAIVLSDLASSAYYVGGDAEKVIGKSAPWFVLAVMLFSYAVRSVYIESSSMFVRGGVYRVVKESMGGTLAKLSVSALLFDYMLTGPISAVSAGQYLAGFFVDLFTRFGHPIHATAAQENYFAAFFAVVVTIYFWWKNTQGIHESSEKALWIMKITTAMVVVLIGWCLITVFKIGAHLPPLPTPHSMKFDKESLGWLHGTFLPMIPLVALLVGFGHSVLAMSGEESLAQVYREIEHPKLKNLKRSGLVIFVYSLLFTSLVSFFAVMIIPDNVRPDYFANLIGGLAMYMVGPYSLRLVFQGVVVLVGALILSGAVNTAIVGANGVLNRVSEDGVVTPWFRKPHRRFGTSYRLINLIAGLQLFAIIATRGNVYLLASLYAFGVIWSFAFNGLAVTVLRFKHPEGREFKVPGNFKIGKTEIPIGLGLITLTLFAVALVNLATKPLATISGVSFSIFFYAIFAVSEHITTRRRQGEHKMIEQFRVSEQPLIAREEMRVRPGNILVAIRDPRNLYYLDKVLHSTDTNAVDVVVITARVYRRTGALGSGMSLAKDQLFDEYEQDLFTKVVELAEKAGKYVSLMVVPTTNVFDGIMQTAQRLESSQIVTGISNKLTLDEQGKLTGDAWERLPEPRLRVRLQIHEPNGAVHDYRLGPHTPRLRREDVDLLHNVWLDVTRDPELSSLHHYHLVRVAVEEFEKKLRDPEQRKRAIDELKDELQKGSQQD
jgi:amino acid transporter